MTAPRYARLIAEIWKREEPRVLELPGCSNRDEEIALIEQVIDRKRRRSRWARSAAGWALAATVLIAAAGAWRAHRGGIAAPPAATGAREAHESSASATPVAIAIASGSGSIVAVPGSATPAVVGHPLHPGSRLIVDPNAGAKLSLSTGTHLEVEHGSQLTVIEDGRAQVFALNAGSLHADVAKLGHGERFIVRTADAEVEVRGTSFFVGVVATDLECGGGTTTRVAVDEGIVIVRFQGRQEWVRAGERWPRGCRQTAALTPPARAFSKHAVKLEPPPSRAMAPTSSGDKPPPAAPLPTTQPVPTTPPPVPSSTQGAPSSTLAAENNLFAEGMLARRSGKLSLALDKMEQLLEKYPASHLAENAAVERMRLFRALDITKAMAAARQYLQRYPAGFARTDAEAILAGRR
jgi:hypothetical protein